MTSGVTIIGFVAIFAIGIGRELHARRRGYATLGDVLLTVMRSPVGRVLVLGAWLWLGWHLFVRVGER